MRARGQSTIKRTVEVSRDRTIGTVGVFHYKMKWHCLWQGLKGNSKIPNEPFSYFCGKSMKALALCFPLIGEHYAEKTRNENLEPGIQYTYPQHYHFVMQEMLSEFLFSPCARFNGVNPRGRGSGLGVEMAHRVLSCPVLLKSSPKCSRHVHVTYMQFRNSLGSINYSHETGFHDRV